MSSNKNNPLLEELLKQKMLLLGISKGSEAYQQTLAEYNDILEFVMMAIHEPLPPEYEIDEQDMLEDYVKYKRHYEKTGPYYFSDFIKQTQIIALVTIKRVPWFGELRMYVKPDEIFKGYIGKKVYVIPPKWGIERDEWLRKGRQEVIFADGPPHNVITKGTLGRMPLVKKHGKNSVYSFSTNKKFFKGLRVIEEANMLRLEWEEVREYILSLTR